MGSKIKLTTAQAEKKNTHEIMYDHISAYQAGCELAKSLRLKEPIVKSKDNKHYVNA